MNPSIVNLDASISVNCHAIDSPKQIRERGKKSQNIPVVTKVILITNPN